MFRLGADLKVYLHREAAGLFVSSDGRGGGAGRRQAEAV